MNRRKKGVRSGEKQRREGGSVRWKRGNLVRWEKLEVGIERVGKCV